MANDSPSDPPGDDIDIFAGKPPETLQEYFVVQLRRLRVDRGLSQVQLAQRINYSPGLVSMVETLQRNPSPDFTTRCDEVLVTGGVLSALLPLLDRDGYPSWFRSFVTLEAEAISIETFDIQAVPGLLETPAYAHAMFQTDWPPRSTEELDQLLQVRLDRQRILSRDRPPLLWSVLDESVLRRPVGTDMIMAQQLDHLIALTSQPHIRLQVLPLSRAGRAPLNGPFILLELAGGERVAYIEGPGKGQILPGREDVERCARTIGVMRSEALSVAESVELIAHLREELYEQRQQVRPALVEEQS